MARRGGRVASIRPLEEEEERVVRWEKGVVGRLKVLPSSFDKM
jgi:hypothetical protein